MAKRTALWLMAPVGAELATGEDPEAGVLSCPMASLRLRAGVAAREWKARGNENRFRDPDGAGVVDADLDGTGVCVATKFTLDLSLEAWLAACRAVKRKPCPLVVDITDNPFEKRPPIPAFYAEVLQICDAVVVNSERMAELIAPRTPRRPVVIEDAILGATSGAGFAPGERLELLWFGHPTNLAYLDACMPGLAAFAAECRCRLTVVTEASPNVERWVRNLQSRHAPALEARLVAWSLEATRTALQSCDLVLIPSNPADPFKAGASANRVAEALNAGRFPVASPLQSYRQFADAAWLAPDLVAGIRWALANRDAVLARIRRGQAQVSEKFAAGRIGRQWGELFDDLMGSETP
jgi:hypothetical protein